MSICASQLFLTCSYHWIFMKLTQNIRLKGQRSHRLFKVFIMSAPWLCAYLTNSLHILHKYNPRDDDVLHTISRSKGWRSGSHRLFKVNKVFVMSVLWLAVYLTDLFYMWYKYNPWSPDVSHTISISKGQRCKSHRPVGSFGHIHSVSLPIWLIDMWPRNKS